MESQEAINKLVEGNRRYVSGALAPKDVVAKRNETKTGQAPFVTVVSCSDSRVVPEYIFDQNLGEVFVVRTAGNVIDKIAVGSVEYAVEHLHTPLVVVLGHEKCGAVTAACAGGECGPNIGAIVKKMKKPVKRGSKDVEKTVCENIKAVVREIRRKSKEIAKLESEGKVKILGMKYYFEDGRVENVC